LRPYARIVYRGEKGVWLGLPEIGSIWDPGFHANRPLVLRLFTVLRWTVEIGIRDSN